MGRTVKRVSLDFSWPHNQPWSGYFNPHYQRYRLCERCRGWGYSEPAQILHDRWHGHMLFKPEEVGNIPFTPQTPQILEQAARNVRGAPAYYGTGAGAVTREANRLCKIVNGAWRHHLRQVDVDTLLAAGRLRELMSRPGKLTGHRLTAAEVNLWSLGGAGLDVVDGHIVIAAECTRLGASASCTACKGEGHIWESEEVQAQAEAWKPTEPPVGPGYQLWNTGSEGSPISPVFAEPKALADWLAAHLRSRLDEDTTAEEWLAFIQGPS